MKKVKQIFLSFIGSNDGGNLVGKPDGAILTALKNEKFSDVHLFWNKGDINKLTYKEIANYLKTEIVKRKLAKHVQTYELPIKDVTDHNQIYLILKEFSDKFDKNDNLKYTAAISSGTPAMQVCWILLSESGDFSESNKLNLVKVKDPKYGKSENIPVKIDTALPKIIRLKEEVENLKNDLVPNATILITKPILKIGDTEIILSPMELAYYTYFAERVINGMGDEKFTGYNTSNAFLDSIIKIHEELYPDLDSNRIDLITIRKKDIGLSIYTFRGNISKLNKKIKDTLRNETIFNIFEVYASGGRGAKFYGIKAPMNKLFIIK